MTSLDFSTLAPVIETAQPKDLTYNGKMPKHDVIVECVWHPGGNEILECTCMRLTPCDITASCIEGELDGDLIPAFDDIPKKGVWRVIAAGKMDGFSYETECGREYDSWVDWEILSANKFPCFGSLKEWFKAWKKEN